MIGSGSSNSLLVEPEQNFPLNSPSISQNPQETDPGMVVSQSVSVSKVSVKMGDVSEGSRSLNTIENNNFNNNYLSEVVSLPIVNPRVAHPPQSYLQHLLEQLNQIATVNVGEYDANVDNDVEYQLVYKDDSDYISDYELDQLSDEYLDYLYQMYDDIGNVLSFYDDTVINEAEPEIHENDDDMDSAVIRSEMAIGRALDPEEDITEQLFENVVAPATSEEPDNVNNNKLEYVDKFLNISKEEVKEETTETTIEDFVVELKSTSDNSDVYIKIGIFITVTLAVLIMTAGLIYVMLRRRKIKTVSENSLVTNEDEAAVVNNQVVFQKGLRTTSSLQEHFNSHFGKAAYLYDDLHSLDNDSFLTSLETISEKDRFDWE